MPKNVKFDTDNKIHQQLVSRIYLYLRTRAHSVKLELLVFPVLYFAFTLNFL
jgi:hypothetical protein